MPGLIQEAPNLGEDSPPEPLGIFPLYKKNVPVKINKKSYNWDNLI